MPSKGRKRAPSPPEFRRQMVDLVRAGRTPEELEREFEPTAQTIRNWVAQAERDEGRRADGLTSAERQELQRLRRENRQLKVERDILSRAAAWFARETKTVPPKDTGSGARNGPFMRWPRCAAFWASAPAAIMRGGDAALRGARARMPRCGIASLRFMRLRTGRMVPPAFTPSLQPRASTWAASAWRGSCALRA